MAKPLDRRTQAARQPDYRRLYKRMVRLEDVLSYFDNRISTLEKKLTQSMASRPNDDRSQ
jgi:hypothetical protein